MKKIKVIVVDDSAVVRNILITNLKKYDDIEIVGAAQDPYEARDLIVKLKPDVITLDIEMPRMTGLEFISVLMEHYPLPIIVISSLVSGNCETSMKALELGAVEIFPKPTLDISRKLPLLMNDLHNKIINASQSKIIKHSIINRQSITEKINLSKINTTDKIIAIGASTGGTEAIRRVLEPLPANLPPIIITQHMPAGFTNSFAQRLNQICKNLEVREAEHNLKLYPGLAVIAPGDYHLLLKRDGAKFKTILNQSPRIFHQRPAVDVMFTTAANEAGKNVVAALLTGMGADGAAGLLKIRQAGGRTISQSEKTCVVYGMPREAELCGASEFVEDLDEIPERIMKLLI